MRWGFLSFIILPTTFANGESYQEFFDRICDDVIPPKAVFQMPISSHIPTYMWPQDRKEIVKIRESVDTRCGEFLLNLYGHIFRITAGVPRNLDFSLKYPNKKYPYSYKESIKPLNFLLLRKEKRISLNDNNVPCGGKSYISLIRDFTLQEDIKTFATNILRILKCKENKSIIEFSKAELLEKNSEIAGLIITSEYFRGRQSLAIAYTELYKLKHVPTLDNLNKLFRAPNCELIFTNAGGSSEIMQTNAPILITSFESMLDIALNDPPNKEISLIYQKLSQDNQKIAKEEFFAGKLEKLRYIYDEISEYTPSKFKPYTKVLYALQKLKLSSILLQWRIAKIEKLIRTINSDDLISQFDIFKQIYNFVQENNINNEVNHKLFQYFKETLTEQPFIRFMKELFLEIDNNAIKKTEMRGNLATILGNISVSSIYRFLYKHCPLAECRLSVIDLSEIVKNLENRGLIPDQFIITS